MPSFEPMRARISVAGSSRTPYWAMKPATACRNPAGCALGIAVEESRTARAIFRDDEARGRQVRSPCRADDVLAPPRSRLSCGRARRRVRRQAGEFRVDWGAPALHVRDRRFCGRRSEDDEHHHQHQERGVPAILEGAHGGRSAHRNPRASCPSGAPEGRSTLAGRSPSNEQGQKSQKGSRGGQHPTRTRPGGPSRGAARPGRRPRGGCPPRS